MPREATALRGDLPGAGAASVFFFLDPFYKGNPVILLSQFYRTIATAMPLIEITLPNSIARALRLPTNSPRRQQLKVLRKLLRKARFTSFGQKFRFDEILLSKHPGKKFQQLVPTYDYSKIHEEWWHKSLEGQSDICWPGKIKYYALSSGTSEASSKYIPVTNDLLRGNRIVMIKQLLSLRNYHDLPKIGRAHV